MDFPYTCNFVEFIRENFENDFTIGVTGYPQKHPRSSDMTQELEYLKMKVNIYLKLFTLLFRSTNVQPH